MIDLHTHLLWDWDDGPDDLDQARTMCRLAEKDGTEAICLTPHVFRMTRHEDDLGILRQRMAEFDTRDARGGDRPRVPLRRRGLRPRGGRPGRREVPLHGRPDELRLPRVRGSEGVPVGAADMLAQLMSKGFVPIISHPERNRGFAARPELLFEFVSMGCAAQVTAASLTGELGREVRSTAGLFMVAQPRPRHRQRRPRDDRPAAGAQPGGRGRGQDRRREQGPGHGHRDPPGHPRQQGPAGLGGARESPAAEDLDPASAGDAEAVPAKGGRRPGSGPTTVLKIK